MQYQANPVIVEAYRIAEVTELIEPPQTAGCGYRVVTLENGCRMTATPAMLARMTPVEGDYWVIQADGYAYLNPADVFLRKYSPVMEPRSGPACFSGSD